MKIVEFYTEVDSDEDFYYPQLPDWCNTPMYDDVYISHDDQGQLQSH